MTSSLLLLLASPLPGLRAQLHWTPLFEDCHVQGSVTLFDQATNTWLTNDPEDSHTPTLPASTFKVINTLIALETGVIQSVDDTVRWPGRIDTTKYGYRPDIFRDLTVREAFRYSAGWAYVELAKRIGKARYRDYLKRCGYGNLDLSQEDADFWNFGPFAISPFNQVEVLRAIYHERLPFAPEHYAALKDIMLVEQTDTYTLRAKTGWTRDGGINTGWWVGYVQRGANVYFFATRLLQDRSRKRADFGRCRIDISRQVLRELGILD